MEYIITLNNKTYISNPCAQGVSGMTFITYAQYQIL